jgi:hypothetical protein
MKKKFMDFANKVLGKTLQTKELEKEMETFEWKFPYLYHQGVPMKSMEQY